MRLNVNRLSQKLSFFIRSVMEKYKNILYNIFITLILSIGVYFRTKLYFFNNVFSDDECRLILSLIDKNLIQSMLFLGNAQSAPPLFILVSKLILYIAGWQEIFAKFVPYIAGIGSLFVFYKTCNCYLKSKFSKVCALSLFAISQPLILFSSIFKQYSTDIFVSILCLYFMTKVKIKDLSKSKLLLLALCIMVLPLISLPSLFFIGAFVIQNIIENFRNKDFYKRLLIILIPFVLLMGGYYIFNLAPARADLYRFFPDYWDDGFWNLSFGGLVKLLVLNFKFWFVPNVLTLPALILFVWGAGISIKEKKYGLLSVVALVLFASLIKLYPLSGRVGLYFAPVVMLFMLKPLDSKKKGLVILALLLCFTAFCKYDFDYLKNINSVDYFISYSPKVLMFNLVEKFNPKSDIIICNPASSPSYLYYSAAQKFYPDDVYEMPVETKDKEVMLNYLNGLKKGQKYWFYLVKDYNQAKVFPFIFEWLEGKNVLYKYLDRNSYLIYLEN